MSLNRSNFGFDMNSLQFKITLEKQKKILLDNYRHYYDSEYREFYKIGSDKNLKIHFDETLLEKAIQNPEVLKDYYTVSIMDGHSPFDLSYPIEVASSLGLKEMVCYLKNMGHFTPFVQARLICEAIKDKNIELVQFYIDCGVSVNVYDVSRRANIFPNVRVDSKGRSFINPDMNKYPYSNYVNQGNYLSIKEGYYSLPPQGEPLCHALFYAIQAESIEITQLLLKSGALFTNLSPNELSYLSEIKKSEEMEVLLKQNGHDEGSKNDTIILISNQSEGKQLHASPSVEFDLAMQQKAQSTSFMQSLMNGFLGFWNPKIANEKDKNQVVPKQSNSFKL